MFLLKLEQKSVLKFTKVRIEFSIASFWLRRYNEINKAIALRRLAMQCGNYGKEKTEKVLKAGETFEINFIAENNGADGYINVEVLVDGELAATKMIAVSAGSFRVVTIPLTLDAGEHVITVGGMTANLTVE